MKMMTENSSCDMNEIWRQKTRRKQEKNGDKMKC